MSKAPQEYLNEYGLPKTSVNIPMPEDTVKPREISDNRIEKAYYKLYSHIFRDSRIRKIEVNEILAEKIIYEKKGYCVLTEIGCEVKEMKDLYRLYDKNEKVLHRGILKEDTVKIGKYLRNKRLELDITMSQLAKKIGISIIQISDIENGKKVGIKQKVLEAYAKEFNIDLDFLVEKSNEAKLDKLPEMIGEEYSWKGR